MAGLLTVADSVAGLTLSRRIPDWFLRLYITVDETWIHYCIAEKENMLKQGVSVWQPAPKKAKKVNQAEISGHDYWGCTKNNSD